MTSKHTPTPWAVKRRDSGWDIKAGNREVAIVFSRGDDTQAANAAHIVRCVNAHDELVAALRLVDQADGLAQDRANYDTLMASALRAVRAALAKVEG